MTSIQPTSGYSSSSSLGRIADDTGQASFLDELFPIAQTEIAAAPEPIRNDEALPVAETDSDERQDSSVANESTGDEPVVGAAETEQARQEDPQADEHSEPEVSADADRDQDQNDDPAATSEENLLVASVTQAGQKQAAADLADGEEPVAASTRQEPAVTKSAPSAQAAVVPGDAGDEQAGQAAAEEDGQLEQTLPANQGKRAARRTDGVASVSDEAAIVQKRSADNRSAAVTSEQAPVSATAASANVEQAANVQQEQGENAPTGEERRNAAFASKANLKSEAPTLSPQVPLATAARESAPSVDTTSIQSTTDGEVEAAGPTVNQVAGPKLPTTLLGTTRPAAELGSGPQPTALDQNRVLNRVARALERAHGDGNALKIRLSPPELGSLKIEVRVQDGALTARVEAETAMARSVIAENLPDLRERLAEQGIRVESFDVELHDPARHDSQREEGTPSRGRRNQSNRRDNETDSNPQQEADSSRQINSSGDNKAINVIV